MHLNAPWSELWLYYLIVVLFTDLSVLCRWTGVTTLLFFIYFNQEICLFSVWTHRNTSITSAHIHITCKVSCYLLTITWSWRCVSMHYFPNPLSVTYNLIRRSLCHIRARVLLSSCCCMNRCYNLVHFIVLHSEKKKRHLTSITSTRTKFWPVLLFDF